MGDERELEKAEEAAVIAASEETEPDESAESSPTAANIPKGAKERFYDKIPLSVKQLNVIIVVLMIALVVVFVLGALVGNGLLDGPKF